MSVKKVLGTTDTDDKQSRRNREMRDIIQNFTNFNISDLQLCHRPCGGELNVVIFGKHEDGKTTVADLLLEEYDKLSHVDFLGLTVPTPIGEPRQALIDDGTEIRVLDIDASVSASQAKCVVRRFFPSEIHCVLYVWNIGKHRFVPDDRSFLTAYEVR